MDDPFTISLSGVVRALPQVTRIIVGNPQPIVLTRFRRGDLKVAAHLGAIFDALLARSITPEEMDEADVFVEHIALEWQARKAQHRRQQAIDFHRASLAEELSNHRLNVAQVNAAKSGAVSAFYAVCDFGLRQIARTRDLVHAAHHELRQRSAS